MHTFNFTVEIRPSEDSEVIKSYFVNLEQAFRNIVDLSAYALDTPLCSVQHYVERD